MAEDDTAATTPPQTAEHHDSTIAQPPGEQEEADASPIRPESVEETAVRPEPSEDDPQQQIGEEEEPPAAEEDDAATTRPEPNADGSDPVEEDRAPIEIASEEEDAAAVQLEGEKAKSDQPEPIRLELPVGRVKKIMKMDTDINKINSEALHLVSCSAQLFLQFLAEGSGEAAMEKKRKIVKLEHIMTAAKRHRATRDFLVDELPAPSQPFNQKSADRSRPRAVADKRVPAGTRRIDDFFSKPATESPIQVEES